LSGYVERYLAGEINIDDMVSAVLPLERINEAFDMMHAGTTIRSVIRY
jgi:S-(hydroxymethyl)glutathione dehydrogenase/alcohol dehydrogenase